MLKENGYAWPHGGMAGKKVMGMRGGGKASKKGPVKRKKKTSRR